MKAAVINIGDELLIGQIVNTNATYLAKTLDYNGFEVVSIWSINDQVSAISQAMSFFQDQVDLVVMTGGLGPTKDDVTKSTFCNYFKDELIINERVLEHVTQMMESFYKRPITQMNKDQALLPSRSTVLFNEVGTAPGMLMKKNNTYFVSLPGVPYEMKYLVEQKLLPFLKDKYTSFYNLHKTIITQGIGESLLAEVIELWENELPESIFLAYLPSPGVVKLRLTTHGFDDKQLHKELDRQVEKLLPLIKEYFISIDFDEPIEKRIASFLSEKHYTLACAESCTGGGLAQIFTKMAGSSVYFKGSAVTYATESKTHVLEVSKSIIKNYSVVSKEVAEAMALGSKKLFKSDYAIATTGNAGPSKGDADADLGTVCIAIATPEDIFSFEYNFGQPREKVIDAAIQKSLELLYKKLRISEM